MQFSLQPTKERYSIGRLEVDFSLPGDRTISRNHATLQLSENASKLEVVDDESKYKVYINYHVANNRDPINPKIAVELKAGDRVRFGRGTYEFRVENLNFKCLTSTMTSLDKTQLETIMEKLGGALETSINGNCTHLVMTQSMMTLKLLQAMVYRIPIVNVQYFKNILKAIATHSTFPDPSDYIPKLDERFVMGRNVPFTILPQRGELFNNKIVYFFSMRQYDCYKEIVEGSKGICKCIKNQTISKSSLVAPNAIVVQASSDSSQTQGTSEYKKKVRVLKFHSSRYR